MPRIPHSILLKAYNKSSLLPLVLRGSRTLPSAVNELRWLVEYVQESFPRRNQQQKLLQLCRRRSKGEPLQYILGSQPFGNLDIKCRPRVLIPRPETEAYTTYLAKLINSRRLDHVLEKDFGPNDDLLQASKGERPPLKILDLCSGSGCISLLLYSLIKGNDLRISGWDISKDAVALAEENLTRNIKMGFLEKPSEDHHPLDYHNPKIQFRVMDIFFQGEKPQEVRRDIQGLDIIISNPPYISQDAFNRETTRSVRNWEPKLALVPQIYPKPHGIDASDVFYYQLLVLHWDKFHSRILLMEVGDDAQALRVVRMAIERCGTRNDIEIWRDWPEQSPDSDELHEIAVNGRKINVRGSGRLRSVVLFAFGTKSGTSALPCSPSTSR